MTHRQDLHVRQGETWTFVHTHRDADGNAVDLTGHSARMRVAAGYEGLAEAFLSTGADAQGGTLALGGAAGTITISFTAAESAAIAGNLSELIFVERRLRADRYVDFIYDLEIASGAGAVTRVLEGRFRLQREVTGWPL